MPKPENGMRFRPLLIKDVAKVAGEPRETIRTREKKGIYRFERDKGWKRYSDFETLIIAFHAHLKRAIHDDEMAEIGMLLAGSKLVEEWIETENGVPYFHEETFTRDRFMFFWRDAQGAWSASLDDAPDAAEAQHNTRITATYKDAPVFICVNFGTIMKRVLLAMLNVQVEIEQGKSAERTPEES